MSEKNLRELMDSIIAESSVEKPTASAQADDIEDNVAAGAVISAPEASPIISDDAKVPVKRRDIKKIILKIIITAVVCCVLFFTGGMLLILMSAFTGLLTENLILVIPYTAILAALFIPPIWINKSSKLFTVWKIFAAILIVAVAAFIVWLFL